MSKLENLKQTVKENPYSTIAALSSFIGLVAPLVGVFGWLDSRYAHAEDVIKQQSSVIREMSVMQRRTSDQLFNLRKQGIEDKMFEIELKMEQGNASNIEKAQYERLKRQYKDVDTLIQINGNSQSTTAASR